MKVIFYLLFICRTLIKLLQDTPTFPRQILELCYWDIKTCLQIK